MFKYINTVFMHINTMIQVGLYKGRSSYVVINCVEPFVYQYGMYIYAIKPIKNTTRQIHLRVLGYAKKICIADYFKVKDQIKD